MAGSVVLAKAPHEPALPQSARHTQVPLRGIGLIVASTAVPATPAVPPQRLALQVAIFASEEEAAAFVKELAKMELEGFVVAMPTREGLTLYGVEAGAYQSRREAVAAADALEHKHGLRTTVVPASKREIKPAPAP